ncbi:hypothetical protein [Brevundimonas sp.]
MSIAGLALSLTLASTTVITEGIQLPAAPPRCAALAAAPVCRDTPHGVIVGPAEGGGEAAVILAAEEARVAEQTWTSIFGIDPAPYAVVLDQALPSESLRAAGALRVLPWMSLTARRTMMEQGIRDAVAGQVPASQVEALTAAAMLQAAPQMQISLDNSAQPGVMAHELGHIWYMLGFWADAPQGDDRYGSPAPDWLDEAAAVLMEREALTEARRAAFHKVWAEAPRLDAVSELMAEVHPAFASGASVETLTNGAASASGPVVMMMSGEEFQRRTGTDIGAAAAFYTRVRAFVDFMEARTGDHQAVVRLTTHLRAGGTVADWFAQDPAGVVLGGSVAAADSAFKVWADIATAEPT